MHKFDNCTELVPLTFDDTDRLGFGARADNYKGEIIMASDSDRPNLQTFVFAFGQGSSEVAHANIVKDTNNVAFPKVQLTIILKLYIWPLKNYSHSRFNGFGPKSQDF